MTHIERQRRDMEATQQEVQAVMRMNESRYSDNFYEAGCQYLERLEKDMKRNGADAPEMWQKIKGAAEFWKWWRIQFNLKNKELLSIGYHSEDQFLYSHSTNTVIIPKHVLNAIFPTS